MAKDVYRGSVPHALKVNTVPTWLTDPTVKWMPLRRDTGVDEAARDTVDEEEDQHEDED
jgi:hypothetical protein